MPQLDSYEVWIQVDGKKLPEYGMHYSKADQTEITCWIPSEVGKVRYPPSLSLQILLYTCATGF